MASYDPKLDIAGSPELTKRLLGFADALLRRQKWRGTLTVAPGSPDAEALVVDAFSKCASGERPYRGKVPLFIHLTGIIRSEISHLQRKRENKQPHLAITNSAARGAILGATIPDTDAATAEDILIAADWLTLLRTAFANDSNMLRYIDLRQTEMFASASEYARELGLSVLEVFNMNRRLKRFLDHSRGEGHED
jgi:DNA-directed RNA polymerase specialized sigma24 family protein